jgi:hypothetical protein
MDDFLMLRQGSQWIVAALESQVLSRCCPDNGCVGYALLAPNEENTIEQHRCSDAPDGSGCQGHWKEIIDGSLQEQPQIIVRAQ